ncbi:MAG TPA: CRISPR system precrRNA processing endoribonuclease RAMP protein Cas6 [Bryobacteraceae bacterium]|nr:CRISPR system precrRNA processing endoribonuclease RAMP protein Cas6 [Bryobacteraceae bacterium]
MVFRLHPLRFSFIALEPIRFEEGQSANMLRGAFGSILRRIVCVQECASPASCERRAGCPYARLFEPSAIMAGPSGLADWPRPFVFRAMHLDGRTFLPGAGFYFDLNLFDTDASLIGHLVRTFSELAREGLGRGRRKVELTEVLQLDGSGAPATVIYGDGSLKAVESIAPVEFSTDPGPEPVLRVRVKFATPTELKSGRQVAARPEFGVLARRIRDRISTLRELYGGGALDIDFQGFGERASLIKMTRCEMTTIDVERRSTRTGQVHSIGGLIGEAEYEGDLREFLPYLRLGTWTGVGRQTVWGKGAIEVEAL